MTRISEAQVQRGSCALMPFVHSYRLGLNPEDVDHMVAVVLRHAGGPDDVFTPEQGEVITASVDEELREKFAQHTAMMSAMQAQIDRRREEAAENPARVDPNAGP